MALFQTYESEPLSYDLGDGPFRNDCIPAPYAQSLNCSGPLDVVQLVWAQRHEGTGGHSRIYTMGWFGDKRHRHQMGFMAAFDGQTGQMLWKDYDVTMSLVSGAWFVDLDNRLWINTWGGTRRARIAKEGDSNVNAYSRAPGMSVVFESDLLVLRSHFKDIDGADLWADGISDVLAILTNRDRALLRFWNIWGTNNMPVTNKPYNMLFIHKYSDGKNIGAIHMPGNPILAMPVDDTTTYVVCDTGAIAVVDHMEIKLKGIFYVNKSELGYRFKQAGYDPVYRRLVSFVVTPDDPDGASTTKVKGFIPRELPRFQDSRYPGLTHLVPLQVPREGRTITAVARAYGDGGHGIPGIRVRAQITSGGTNTITPEYAISDYSGYVRYTYTCNDQGADIDDVNLTAEFDTESEGIAAQGDTPWGALPPTAVDSTRYFAPGWWGYTTYSSGTPAAKWDTYLSDYGREEDGEERSPLRGVMHDYAWTDVEPDIGTWTDTKIQADLDYLATKGMKLIIRFDLYSPDDETYWLPDDIVNQLEPPLHTYAVSLQPETGNKGGIMHLTSARGQGYYPMLWDPPLRGRFNAMITHVISTFAFHEAFGGIAPVGYNELLWGDIQHTYTDGTPSLLGEARRAILTYTEGLTTAPVWDFARGWGDSWWVANKIFWGVEGCSIAHLGDLEMSGIWFPSNHLQTVGNSFVVKSADYSQTTCNGTTVTPREMLFGGPNMSIPNCVNFYATQKQWWYAFLTLQEPQWSLADEGVKEVVDIEQLDLASRYSG